MNMPKRPVEPSVDSSAHQAKSSPPINWDSPPTQEEIEKRAYEIYCQSGRIPGRSAQNWFQAEQSFRRKGAYQPPASQSQQQRPSNPRSGSQ